MNTQLLDNIWANVQTKQAGLPPWLVNAARGAYGELGSAAKGAYGELGSAAKGAYGELGSAAKGAYGELGSAAKGAYGDLGSAARGIRLQGHPQPREPIIGSAAKGALGAAKGTLNLAKPIIGSAAKGALGAAKGTLNLAKRNPLKVLAAGGAAVAAPHMFNAMQGKYDPVDPVQKAKEDAMIAQDIKPPGKDVGNAGTPMPEPTGPLDIGSKPSSGARNGKGPSDIGVSKPDMPGAPGAIRPADASVLSYMQALPGWQKALLAGGAGVGGGLLGHYLTKRRDDEDEEEGSHVPWGGLLGGAAGLGLGAYGLTGGDFSKVPSWFKSSSSINRPLILIPYKTKFEKMSEKLLPELPNIAKPPFQVPPGTPPPPPSLGTTSTPPPPSLGTTSSTPPPLSTPSTPTQTNMTGGVGSTNSGSAPVGAIGSAKPAGGMPGTTSLSTSPTKAPTNAPAKLRQCSGYAY